MLKWLTKKVYSSLSEVLAAVYKELNSLQPVDTDTVKWTKGLTGMKAHAVVQNSPVAMNQVQGDEVVPDLYMGTFKVGRIDGVMYLYDGSNPDSDVAGVIKAGTASISVPKTEITIESGYVYVYLTYDTGTSSYSVTVTTTYTTPGDRTEYYTIARIYQSTVYAQMHITGDITVVGRWV